MKNYFLFQALILTGLFNTAIKAMEDEQKQLSLCRQILTIDPDAPAADYKALAQRLHDANLSTCECATYLTHEKKQKALKAFKKKGFLSDRGIKRINEFQNEIKKINKPLNKLVVTISEYLPEDIKDVIKKEVIDHFSPRFAPIKFKNEYSNHYPTAAGISCYLPTELSRYIKKPLGILQFKHSSLNIGRDILDSSFYGRKFTYLHEEQHLKDRHAAVRTLLAYESERMLIKKGIDYELYNLGKLNDKFSRATETEADLIPTACGSCDEAYSAVEDFGTLPKDDLKHHDTHPSILTRYKRAQRIYHLKLAEEELIQKEEIRIAYALGLI